jgi:hypothetical protein
VLALGALLVVAAATASGAQSLGEVAKKEEARRAGLSASGRVFTNGDLKPDPTTPTVPNEPPSPSPAANTAVENADGKPATALDADREGVTPLDLQEPQASSDKGQDFWTGRALRIRSRLASQNTQIEALKQRLASLGDTDQQERSIATRTLALAIDDLTAYNDEWLRFERQAREQGIPTGWIR